MVQGRCGCTCLVPCNRFQLVLWMLERRLSLLLPPPIASGRFAVVLSSLSLFAQFICLQGQSPLDAFILRSLVQFLLCSVHLSLVAVFFPIKIQSSVVRLHYTSKETKYHLTNTLIC